MKEGVLLSNNLKGTIICQSLSLMNSYNNSNWRHYL